MATCPKCGNSVGGSANFCPLCGTPVDGPPPAEAYQIVTVFFCDVVESTRLGSQLEPQPMQRVMDRYDDTVRRVLRGHGASIGKRHGDGFMAAFGLAELHEDDALRAVRAASELRAALAELASDLRRERSLDLKVRFGVNTGMMFVRDAGTIEEEVTGDAVNLAKRFEEAAGPGEIVIGEETYRLVANAVKAEPAGTLAIEGVAAPQEVWRLLEVLPDRPGRLRRLHAPMVGRSREQELLGGVFERVVDERSCHLVTVLGSAGVGKSRLVDEVVRGFGERATVLRAHCLAYGDSVALWPMVEIVRQAAGIASDDPPATVQQRLAELVGGEERGELITRRVAQVLGADQEVGLPEDTLWALRRLLETLAAERPLVVAVDDLQWAEPTLLDAIEYVARYATDSPILLLCMARPDELFARRAAWTGGMVNALSLLLPPLGDLHAEQLVGHLLGGRVDPAAQAHITGWAQGYPLIVEELVANLRDEGKLLAADGRWVLGAESQDEDRTRPSVPTSIQTLLQARLGRLDSRGRALLERAAAVGEQFHTGDIEALDLQSQVDVAAGLQELVRLDLVRPDHGPAAVPLPPGSGEGYRFRHVMIRTVAYEQMPDDRRAELHESYADWLEDKTTDRRSQFDEILGYHLYEAYGYAHKLDPAGARTRELARRAGERYAAAGQRAAVRGDLQLTIAWLRRAATLLPEGHPDRLAVFPPLAEALQAAGELTEAGKAYEQMTRAAVAAGDDTLEARAIIGRLHLTALRDPQEFLGVGRDRIELAIATLERMGDRLGLAKAWHLLAYQDWTRGKLTIARSSAERALAFAEEAGDSYWKAIIRRLHCLILYWGPTPLAEVEQRVQEVLAEAERSDVRSLEATALGILARVAALQGRLDEARELVRRADAVAGEVGESLTQAADCISEALVELLDGNLSRAESVLRAGDKTLNSMGGTGPRAAVAAMLARVLLLQGRDDEAVDMAVTCEQIAPTDQIDLQVKCLSIRAVALGRRDQLEQAEDLARQAVARARETDQFDSLAEARVDLAEVLRLSGRRGEAVRELERAIKRYKEKGNEAGEREVRRLLARVRQ